MRKISLLCALFVSMGIGKTFAGSFAIMNLTPCSFQFYSGNGNVVDPVTGATYGFMFGPITANTGTTSFANPTLLPGFNSNAPANLQASGCVDAIKVIAPGGIGFHMTNASPFNTFVSTNSPACGNYMITWNTGGNNCDVILYIF